LAAGGAACLHQAGAEDGRKERARQAPRRGPAGDQCSQNGAAAQGEGHGGDGGLAGAAKKVGCLLFGGRGRLTRALNRRKAIELIDEAKAAGARLVRACGVIGICLRTFKRWRKAFLVDGNGEDRRKGSGRLMSHQLSEEERQRILLTCNQPEYATLPPGQIVPALAD
jgi:hypothetical protein